MVVMVMADHHDIDTWQILQSDWCLVERFGPAHWTGDARSLKTGSVITNLPSSFINTLE